jgi:hypothetical protein
LQWWWGSLVTCRAVPYHVPLLYLSSTRTRMIRITIASHHRALDHTAWQVHCPVLCEACSLEPRACCMPRCAMCWVDHDERKCDMYCLAHDRTAGEREAISGQSRQYEHCKHQRVWCPLASSRLLASAHLPTTSPLRHPATSSSRLFPMCMPCCSVERTSGSTR